MKSKTGFDAYSKSRVRHWNNVVEQRGTKLGKNFYHRKLQQLYAHHIPKGKRVLEIGCGTGDLLASLKPSFGLGIDISDKMIELAATKYPELVFKKGEFIQKDIDEIFEYIILSDLVNDVWDVQGLFLKLKKNVKPQTRIIINFYSRLWELPLYIAKKVGLANPLLQQNWLTVSDLRGLQKLSGFEPVKISSEILCPVNIPFVEMVCNRFISKISPFKHLNLTNLMISRPCDIERELSQDPLVSIIIAARNEEGHIRDIFERTSNLGFNNELVFVEGESSDNTYKEIENCITEYSSHSCQLYKQSGKGKGNAVRLGFEKAKGDIFMILDADLTVLPEDLYRFYEVIVSGKGEFINGVRLVYPMEDEAMRPMNFLGNKFFSLAFSWLLGQPIKDTLCGTKVLWKDDYEMIKKNRSYFGDFDPFGDFDLLFGAAKLNLKIIDIPVRYHSRVYGDTNIQRWRHGVLLLQMVLFAIRKIKFI